MRIRKVVAAPDKFKGTITAAEVARAIGQACWDLGIDCVEVPMADGGDGILEALGGPGATANTAPATGPTAKPPLPVAQVPGAFASLAAVEVVLGGVDLTWDTPGPNSYIYED